MRPTFDALLLAVLVIARVRIDTLAEASALPLRFQDIARHPLLKQLFSASAFDAFGNNYADPIALTLIAATFIALAIYLLVDSLRARFSTRVVARTKWILLIFIVATTVIFPTAKLILLRQGSGPASYTHDGGVIQTEAATQFFLAGKNPYVEDYTRTPMAEWGFDAYRTALFHYPYLPWTFIFSAPFSAAAQTAFGWFDQRVVYLLLFGLLLALVPGLAQRETNNGNSALALTALIALNPIMANDVIFGQNDSFVLFWAVLAFWLHRKSHPTLAAISFGLACASKPTAWFMLPFFALLLLQNQGKRSARANLRLLIARLLPAALVFAVLVLPYALWNADALIDDVWRWSNGTAQQAYQIWGWGASNLVLAFGWVTSRFAYWPFWLPQAIVSVPALLWLARSQWRDNSLAGASWRYGLFLLLFLLFSRFLNENYLGYLLAFWAIGYFGDATNEQSGLLIPTRMV